MRSFKNSIEYWHKVSNVIPGGCSTIAKSPTRLYSGHNPFYCVQGKGAYFKDVDGNNWLDCDMSMGSLIWGYCNEDVNIAITEQLGKGVTFSLPSIIELELAELILSRLGKYTLIRFCKNGADAVSAAVRLARTATKRDKIVYAAYHGWHDWSAYGYYGETPERLGIPHQIKQDVIWLSQQVLAGETEQLINQYKEDIAGLVLCPGNWSTQDLIAIRELCLSLNIILIFDEVSSGMRWGLKGATGMHNVWPDLLCLSKGLANGLPLAALTGKSELMELCMQIKFSNAHSSECVSIAAAMASEKLLCKQPVWPSWKLPGQQIIDSIMTIISENDANRHLTITGNYAGFRVHTPGKSIHNDLFHRFLLSSFAAHGIFSMGYVLLSASHSEQDIILIESCLTSAVHSWLTQLRKQ